MIYTTPISQYDMQNIQQLGQIMQDQAAYTPSINPFSSKMTPPPGYSMYQWGEELSLARSQYLTKPLYATGNLLATAAYYPLMFTPFTSQMLPEAFGAKLVSNTINGVTTSSWVGGAAAATKLGNIALGVHKAAHEFSVGVGTQFGEAIGYGVGQTFRGITRAGEYTANYATGGMFTRANAWLGNYFGKSSGKLFNYNLSQYIDQGAVSLMKYSDKIAGESAAFTAMSEFLSTAGRNGSSLKNIETVRTSLQNLGNKIVQAKSALSSMTQGTPEFIKATEELAKLQAAEKTVRDTLKAASDAGKAAKATAIANAGKGLRAANHFGNLSSRVLGKVGGIAGAFLNPVFLLKQAVLDKVIDYGVESYDNYNSRTEIERELLAKGGRILRFGDASIETGIDGGFTGYQRRRLVQHLDRLAANDYRVKAEDWFGWGASSIFGGHRKYSENLKELKAILSVSTDMGMLDMSKSLDEVEKRFDSIVKTVKKLSRITGKSKGELAMALASTQQAEGRFDLNDAAASLQKKIYSSYATGASLQTVLQEAALGAQMGMQAGIGKAAGADFMILSRNIFGRMYRRGMMDRGDIDMMGGEQGVVSNLASGMMSMANNNVFKSTMAMLFDPKTGKLNQKRLDMYLNGDSKTLASFMKDRNVLMGTESYNKMSGLMEIGGVLNEKMPYLQYAIQHGDISQDIILKVARRELKAAELLYGTEKAKARTQWNMINTFGAEKGMLLFKALSDPSLLKPDLKEQFAVTRKQLEDRYSAELAAADGTGFKRFFWANGGFGMLAGAFVGAKTGAVLGSALGPLGTVVGGLVGAAAGFATHAQISTLFNFDSTYMSKGDNALTPEMRRIYDLGDKSWFVWNNVSGIEKYKRARDILQLGLTSDRVKISTVANIQDRYFTPITAKDVNVYSEFYDNYLSGLSKTKEEELFAEFVSGRIKEDEFRNRLQKLKESHEIDFDKPSDISGVAIAREAYRKMHIYASEEDVSKNVAEMYNKAREIYGDEFLADDSIGSLKSTRTFRKLDGREFAKRTGAVIMSPVESWYNTRKYMPAYTDKAQTFAGTTEAAQLANQHTLITTLMEKMAKKDTDDAIYLRFGMSTSELYDLYAKKVLKKKGLKELTDKEKENARKWVATVREAGEEEAGKLSVFGESMTLPEKVDVIERTIKESHKDAQDLVEAELRRVSQWAFNNKKLSEGESANDFYTKLAEAKNNGGNYSESQVSLINEWLKAESSNKTMTPDEEEPNLDSVTGGSAFNKELLDVLKGIKVTMDNLNVTLGGSSVPQYTAYR